jgi:hypothetical protein
MLFVLQGKHEIPVLPVRQLSDGTRPVALVTDSLKLREADEMP